MKCTNRDIGNSGEKICEIFLINHKYKILAKNFRNRIGEIDIIALYNGDIIFLEVKARNTLKFGNPCESVTYKKQQKIKSVANYYIYINNLFNKNVRFDVLEVIFNKNKSYNINHIKDAFR